MKYTDEEEKLIEIFAAKRFFFFKVMCGVFINTVN